MATILLVEDEPPLLVLAEFVLQDAGYETVSAATLAEAQAMIHSDKNIDLVFTDITLLDAQQGGRKSVSSFVRRVLDTVDHQRRRIRQALTNFSLSQVRIWRNLTRMTNSSPQLVTSYATGKVLTARAGKTAITKKFTR